MMAVFTAAAPEVFPEAGAGDVGPQPRALVGVEREVRDHRRLVDVELTVVLLDRLVHLFDGHVRASDRFRRRNAGKLLSEPVALARRLALGQARADRLEALVRNEIGSGERRLAVT